MASYDAEIRVQTSIDNKNFIAGADKVQHTLKDIEKEVDVAKSKLKDLETLGIPKNSKLYQSAAKDLAKWTAELEAVKGKQQETTSDFSEHINLMRVDIEEYAVTLKQLEKEGKYFGDADYDKVYLAWKQATEEAKKYQAELNKHTEKGQAEEAEKAARELEKQEAIQRRIEAQAEKNLQKENEALLKDAQKEAKLQAQEAEEQRLADIKAQATVADQRIVSLLERRKQLQTEIAELEKAGVTAGYREYDARQAELKSINRQVSGSADMGGTVAQFAALAGKASKILAIIGAVFAVAKKISSVIKTIASTIAKIVGSLLKKTASAFKFIATQAGKLFSKLTSGFRSSGSSAGNFGDRLLGLVKSVFVFNVISKAFQSMVSGVQDSTKKFTQYSSSFNGNISALVNALSTLKNAIAGAFAPILSIAIPYLVQLINYVTMAVNAVAQLIAALTGASTWSKAVQQNKDYASSLDKVGGSAKKTAGALAKFDDLDVLQKQDSGGGGGAGAGNLWEEVPVSDATKGLADKIKKLLALDDWSELGKMIAGKLTEMLASIPWDVIQAAAARLGKQLGSLLNSFLSDPNLWIELGYALAQGLNTALIFLVNFLSQFDFEQIGNNIGDGINTAIATFDWALLAQTIIVGINGAIALLYGAISFVDLALIGQKLGETLFTILNNLPYEMMAKTVIKGIGKISDAIISFVTELDMEEIMGHIVDMLNQIIRGMDFDNLGNELGNVWEKNGKAVGMLIQTFVQSVYTFVSGIEWYTLGTQIATWFTNAIEEIDWSMAGQAIHNMLNGLLDVILGFLEETDWNAVSESISDFLSNLDLVGIQEKLGKIFKEIFSAALKVLDSEFFEGVGHNIVEGLSVGIWGAKGKDGIINFFSELITNIKNLFGIHSPSTVFAEIGRYLIEGLLLGIQELWVSLQEWFATTFENLILFFSEKWTLIKEGALEIWNSLKECLAETWESIKESVTEKFEAVKEKFEEVWNAVKECIDLKVKGIQEKIKELGDKFSEFKTSVALTFTNIKESIINALSPVIDKLKDFIQWVKDAIQAVKDFFNSGYEQVGTTAGKTSKTTTTRSVMAASPASISAAMADIPRLASGAVLRGGNPFLAVLGDQRMGQTNIEAPLSTIEQAVENVMNRRNYEGNGGQTTLIMNVNGQEFARLTLQDFLSEMNRQGYDVEVLGV
ncbi:hypothetical protein [Eisenbergiella tayi]|uniref:hypothetical protein n=1 Tax=Eisenbergiella tayi TaxID=1432052 RepID=UPI002A82C1E8|nr:hypothetical protein [Eisenbergiella tayi]